MTLKQRSFYLILSFTFFAILAGSLFWLDRPTGSLYGEIVDWNGNPIPGATVTIQAYPSEKKAVSNAAGEFVLSPVPVGDYFINVGRRGYEWNYLNHKWRVSEGNKEYVGKVALREKSPELYFSVWDQTKNIDEKVMLSVSGSRVKEVQFTAYKIDLLRYLAQGGTISNLESEGLNPQELTGLTKVREWGVTFNDSEAIEFDRKENAKLDGEGVYLIHALASSQDRTKVFSRTVLLSKVDFGFVVKRDDNRTLVYTSRFSDQKPVAGASVFLFPTNITKTEADLKPIEAVSDKDGIAEIKSPSDGGSGTILVKKENGVAFVLSPQTLTDEEGGDEAADGGEDDPSETASSQPQPVLHPKVFLYTERPLYRPGQKVYYKGVVRTEDGKGGFEIPPSRKVQLQVQDAKGNIILETETQPSRFGSFWGEIDLNEEAELGYYDISANFAGKSFKGSFEVDEYRKPEFKVEIQPEKNRYLSGEPIRFIIDAQYYFGAPLPEAEVEYTLYKGESFFYLPDDETFLSDADWGDPFSDGYGEVVKDGTAQTDSKGHLVLEFKSEDQKNDQRYTLRVTIKERSEKTVTREAEAQVTAADFFLRMRRDQFFASPEKDFSTTVLARNYDGKGVERAYHVLVEKEGWDKVRREVIYKRESLLEGKTGADGKSNLILKFKEGGYYRLSFSSKDPNGREVLFEDYVWVSGKSEESDFEQKKVLQLIADKKKYQQGEKAKLLIVGPIKNASVWLTFEGSQIYRSQLVQLDGFTKEIEVSLDRDLIPNVYVEANMIGKKESFVASAELQISPIEKYLNIKIEPDHQKYRPADQMIYKVSTRDSHDKPVSAELSLGVVDESIYALKADSTDLKKFFWGPRTNRVGTAYSFSGYYTGGIGKEDLSLLRKNFKDTAFWAPSVVTNEAGEATVAVKLPDNLTTWRTTVLAHTPSTEVGQEVNKVLVSKDLIARIATPRFFRERDQVKLRAFIHNYTDQPQTVNVGMELEGIKLVNPKDGENRTLQIEPQKVGTFDFDVIAEKPGESKIQLLAKNEKVSDGVELKLPVLAHGIEEHQYAQGEIAPATETSSAETVRLDLLPKVSSDRTSLTVTYDTHLVGRLIGSLDYLIDYPYGCVEQTMSRLLPALMVQDLYRELHFSAPNLERKIPKVVEKGVRRIIRMQHGDGGWGWWMNDTTNPFMTAYALFGLVRAQQLGQKIDPEIINKGKEALGQILTVQKLEDPFLKYVYALAGGKTGRSKNDPQTIDLAFEILSLKAQKQKVDLKPLRLLLEQKANCNNGLCFYQVVSASYYMKENWSSVEATSWALQALVASGSENKELQAGLVRWLFKQQRGGFWRHTRETAFVIYALTDTVRSSGETEASSEGVKARLLLNDKELKKTDLSLKHHIDTLKTISAQPGRNNLTIENLSSAPLYYQTDFKFFSSEEDLAASSNGIRVQRDYFRLKRVVKPDGSESYEPTPLQGVVKKGEWIGVRVTLNADLDSSYILVEDPLPAGFEVIKDIQFDSGVETWSEIQTQDEKVSFFVGYLYSGKRVFNYVIRPELEGDFHVMPSQASMMYQPEKRGSGSEYRFQVR